MALTATEIKNRLDEQFTDPEAGTLLLQPHEDLPCIGELFTAYLSAEATELEILEATVSANASSTVVNGYAALFGLPPIKLEATFNIEGEDVHLNFDLKPEMGVTPTGLFPELTGSGIWVPLGDVELKLKSNAETPGNIELAAGLEPRLDDLLEPLLSLLTDSASLNGNAVIGDEGKLQSLRIETAPLKTVSFNIVTLSDIKIALEAEENEYGLVQAMLMLEGQLALELKSKTITIDFSLLPAPPDQPYHILYAGFGEEEGDSLDSDSLDLALPAGLPAELKLQSIQVLLGVDSKVPEDVTLAAVLEGEMELLPGITVYQIGGNFTLWPTADPVSGRADIYGKVSLGGAELGFELSVPEQEFSIELDPETGPNIKQTLEDLIDTSLPDSFPDMDIVGFSIAGNAKDKIYNFYFGLDGVWEFKDIIGLDLSLKSIALNGGVDSSGDETDYYGELAGVIQLGDEPEEGEMADGLIELSVELTSEGAWILEGGLANGSVLSLPQLVSVVGIAEDDVPDDLSSLVITELNASLNTDSGQASFHAASGFSLNLPFGGADLDLSGSISLEREKSGDDWVGEAAGEMQYKTLRLKAAFPINDPDMNLSIGLWLPEAGDPDAGAWLDCVIEKNEEGSIEELTISLSDDLNIFSAIEGFINLMIPGFQIKFPYPWDELKKLSLPPTVIAIKPREKSVSLGINGGFGEINKIPGIKIESIRLFYDTDDKKIDFQMVGQIFDSKFTDEKPLSFDPVSEDPPAMPAPTVGFDLRYLGVGRHVAMRDVSGYEKIGPAIEDLRSAFDSEPREGAGALGPLGYNKDSEWLIGFDFTAAGFVSIGALFNDPVLYGLIIKLDGPAAKSLSGFEFEILYRRIAPGLGVYSMELELPPVFRTIEMGAVTLKLPVIAVDIYTNGNFKLDLGFPYGANFARSFYIGVFPFAGFGGFYYASLNGATSTTVPQITNGKFNPVIEFGIGLSVGVGKSIGSGCMTAEVYVGVLAIVEGTFATFLPYDKGVSEDQFYRISGTFGIDAYVRGRVDFKVISVNFSVEVYLIAMVTIECYMPFYINARAGVRVKARVKVGFFKVTLKFSTQVRISYTFGKRSPTPWIVGNPALPASMGRGQRFRERPRFRSLPMTMGSGAVAEETVTFDWNNTPTPDNKSELTWYTWYGVSVDLDASSGGDTFADYAVAAPLAGFAGAIDPENSETDSETPPEDFETWLYQLYCWLLTAWHGELPTTVQFSNAERMDASLQSGRAASSLAWSELNTFISSNFTINLTSQPGDIAGGADYKMALLPLPPAIQIKFEIEGAEGYSHDLSSDSLIARSSLNDIRERANRYAPEASRPIGFDDTGEEPEGSEAPLAEHLWLDIVSLQLKETAARLLSLMEKCPVTISGENSYSSLGEIYENLVYDPNPNDADREPFFEEFIEANQNRTGLLVAGVTLTIPRQDEAIEYTTEDGDTLQKISDDHGLSALDLALANLYVELVKPESEWIVPYINELTPATAWEKLKNSSALSDISAMTSRFLLHGVRLPVEGDWRNLYEAGSLQFGLPVSEGVGENSYSIGAVKLTFTPSENGHQVDWLKLENDSVELNFSANEESVITTILEDQSFAPEATVTGMAMTRDEMLDFTLARASTVRRQNDDEQLESDGRLRTLPGSFFKYLATVPDAEAADYQWLALPARRSGTNSRVAEPANPDDPERLVFSWAARLGIEVSRLDNETAIKGRNIYRITNIEPTSRLMLERILDDIKQGLISAKLAPAVGAAGAATNDGGLLTGNIDASEIILFRNDADDRPDTPASATNREPLDFLQLLAESLDEEGDTFFLADVLPGVSDVNDRIFAGTQQGVVTIVIFPEGEVNPLRHVDSIYLAEGVDKGSEALRFTAAGLTRKRARYAPDMLQFRVERPEPTEEESDGLESLYSLLSFYFSDENGEDCSVPSLPIGPREEVEGTWLYEQLIPVESALSTRAAKTPYSMVGETRYLNITWRDLFGNEAGSDDFTFTGYAKPPEPGSSPGDDQLKLIRLPLKCYYYDEIIGVNRWPGVQVSHRFKGSAGSPQLEVSLRFDPSLLGQQSSNSDTDASTREELNKISDQLQDERLTVQTRTTLEIGNDSEPQARWKNKLLTLVQGVESLFAQAEELQTLELKPRSGVKLNNFRQAHRISGVEFGSAVMTLPLGELFKHSDALPLMIVPIKWQVEDDSLNSIATALGVTIDSLIETLLDSYGDETGLLTEGNLTNNGGDITVKIRADHTLNSAAADFNLTPANFLLEFADRSEFLAAKQVLQLAERTETLQVDESLGAMRRRLIYEIETEAEEGAATSGMAIAPELADLIIANGEHELSGASPIALENRQTAPGAEEVADWHSSSLTTPLAVATELGISLNDFLVLNALRADIIQSNQYITLEISSGKDAAPANISFKSVASDNFETLRQECTSRAGRTVTIEEFGAAIQESNLLKAGSSYLKPPATVKLSRSVTPRATPAAYELKAFLVLKRFNEKLTSAELELIHPELQDESAIWYSSSEIAAAIESRADSSQNTTSIKQYADDFQKALKGDNLQLGLGTPRRAGGEKPTLWAVRLGTGGINFQINAKKPAFLSLRPLATTPMNRKQLPIFKFIEGEAVYKLEAGEESYGLQNFSEIDFDEWALNTLTQLDRLLRPANALALAEAGATENGNSYDELLKARAELAAALTTGLTEIIDYPAGEPAESEVTRRIMRERIGNQLAAAYDIDTTAFFPLTFKQSGGEPFKGSGNFVEDRNVARDTGYTLQATNFERNDDYLVMPVDVLKPEEHRTVDTKVDFQLSGLELENGLGEEVLLSFVLPPDPNELGELSIPVVLRDLPEAPRLSRQQGVADYEMDENGYPELDSYNDLLAWRYEVDFQAEFAEQDTHTMEIFFNLQALEELPPMLGANGRIFQDLFHALAQCDTTLVKYIDLLEKRVAEKYEAGDSERSDLHWILDDMTVMLGELALHWREHYERGGPIVPASLGEGLQTTKHRYEFREERYTRTNVSGEITRDDLLYTFKCAPGDPTPLVRVEDIEGVTSQPRIVTLPDGSEQAIFTVTLRNWFTDTGKTSDELEELPRRFGFQDLQILEKQNVRVRIKTVRNADLLPGQPTAEAFIYRTPVVTLPDRFFPAVELEKRVKIAELTPGGKTKNYAHSTELLSDILHNLLGLEYGQEKAGLKRRVALTVRYGFAVAGEWSETDSFVSETPLFFEPRTILDHLPTGTDGFDTISRLGREMEEWLNTAGARRENAGFVIGVDVYTDETLNPALVEPNPDPTTSRDDVRLLRIIRLESEFPGE